MLCFSVGLQNMEGERGVPVVVYPDTLLVLVGTRFIICNKTENSKESIMHPSQINNKLTIITAAVV